MPLRDKRILVSGGSGFLGRHVLHKLREKGCRHVLAAGHERCDSLDRSSILEYPHRNRPEVVIHLVAAVGGIGLKNLMTGVKLVDECRHVGVDKSLAVGTICLYPKNTPVLWDGYLEETNAPDGLYGTGTPAREFLFVADAIRAIALAVERLDSPEPVNIGTGREIAIRDLFDLIGFPRTSLFRFFDAGQPTAKSPRCRLPQGATRFHCGSFAGRRPGTDHRLVSDNPQQA